MSFVPRFTELLLTHLQQEERQRILKSIVVSVAPELWLSLESAALLDINREHFGLGGQLDERDDYRPSHISVPRCNVPRWLIAAERRKVDIWVEDSYGEEASTAIEFKVVHNNKNAYYKIWEIRKDLVKQIPRTSPDERIERWGIVLLSYSRFYSDQQGNYSYGKFDSCQAFLDAFENGLNDNNEWYADAPELELEMKPTQITNLDSANYIEPGKGSGVYLALVRCKA
ncbi:hypothetical protein DMX09_18410 [Pseudomonas protegens]|uniref:hypothetical protein n=1 Tax=Pseudomonas TaxID=286 RepID=UPI000D8E9CE3|nr:MULTISPECIES: hypothetical protein [Pseudomonas]MDD1018379.1 hypothetical protein [Pseudomonas idahonensis]MDP9504604.1 hypothetical protein [Pseudomonas protegens]MDP9511551.1 hypothetical protein [Pseudomonas protegens]PYC01989.1 hypothetical protein DMX09_18410 [Pseudomonas protegens]